MPPTSYRLQLAGDAELVVWFLTERGNVISYSVVLLALHGGAWRTVRVYDNAHGANEMRRYTLAGGKQPAELVHAGEAGEAMRAARDEVLAGYEKMIEAWRAVEDKRSVASELAAERFRLATELAVAGKSPYPDGAAFVASDMPDLGAIVARHARERRPVVLVYPDGEERVLAPGQLAERGAA